MVVLWNGQREEFMQPISAAWLNKVQEAIRHKQPFNDIAEQCMGFFAGPPGFLWESKFFQKYVGGRMLPRFKITIAKAFELVALFGPVLYWRNPQRQVRPRKSTQIGPEVFQAIWGQQAMTLYQQLMSGQQTDQAVTNAISQLLEAYLNYTPVEQPGGGLAGHASQGITEALIKGRGCVWPQPYFMPGSDRVLTGCFYDSVDNLLIDPDATTLHDAKWIAQECVHPVDQVEDDFQLPRGSLAGKGTIESAWAQGEHGVNPSSQMNRRIGKTFDYLRYYKIYSKGGVGGRLSGDTRLSSELSQAFEQVVGKFAYIVVAPNIPWPLNAPAQTIRSATDSEVRRRLTWPIPYYLDERWPVSVLDFYFKPNSPWPIAPLAPGLGELTFQNVMFSSLANRIWQTSRTLIAARKSLLSPEVEAAIRSGNDLEILKLEEFQKGITEEINFLSFPETNLDVWKILEENAGNFDRRTGLTELLYGLNAGGTQSRTAEDAANKREMISVRPDYMAGRVEDWMTEVADMEKLCARWFVKPNDLRGLFSAPEQFLWNALINNQDPEMIAREVKARVVANSMRKPDKRRDVENINQILPALLPELSKHADATFDTQPLNALLQQWGHAIDYDVAPLMMGPRMPQQMDNSQEIADEAMQQQMAQLEQSHAQKLQQGQETHEQKILQKEQQHRQQMLMKLLQQRVQQRQAA